MNEALIFEIIIVIFLFGVLCFVVGLKVIKNIPRRIIMFFGIFIFACLIPFVLLYDNADYSTMPAPDSTSSPSPELTDMATPIPAHRFIDCQEQTNIETESLRVHIGSDKQEIRIHEKTVIQLFITSKENEKNLVVMPVIPASGFSVLSTLMPSTLKPHGESHISIEIQANEAKEKPLNAYIQYYYDNIKSESKEVNVSLCISVK